MPVLKDGASALRLPEVEEKINTARKTIARRMGVAGQPDTCNDHKMSINGASKTTETGRCLGILVLLLFGVTVV